MWSTLAGQIVGDKPVPPIIFHFALSFIDEYLSTLPAGTSFDHWYRWTIDDSTNTLRILTINPPIDDPVGHEVEG